MIAYKFMRPDGTTVFTSFAWPLGDDGEPGPWVEAAVEPCRSGIHACRAGDLPHWAGTALFELELDGPVVAMATKVIAPRARVLRRIAAWEEGVRDEFKRMCAERAHAIAGEAGLDGWDAGITAAAAGGPASIGFIAAWVAETAWGAQAYRIERARQGDWLAQRLGLAPAA